MKYNNIINVKARCTIVSKLNLRLTKLGLFIKLRLKYNVFYKCCLNYGKEKTAHFTKVVYYCFFITYQYNVLNLLNYSMPTENNEC